MPTSRTPLGEIVKRINDTTGACTALEDSKGYELDDVFLTPSQVAGVAEGTLLSSDGLTVYSLSETSPYVTLTATGTAFTGACELAGWYCSVAVGNITIYDATSATGTPIVPATALAAGPMPIFGAGTTGKMALTTGCHVVLSGAATVRVLVA